MPRPLKRHTHRAPAAFPGIASPHHPSVAEKGAACYRVLSACFRHSRDWREFACNGTALAGIALCVFNLLNTGAARLCDDYVSSSYVVKLGLTVLIIPISCARAAILLAAELFLACGVTKRTADELSAFPFCCHLDETFIFCTGLMWGGFGRAGVIPAAWSARMEALLLRGFICAGVAEAGLMKNAL